MKPNRSSEVFRRQVAEGHLLHCSHEFPISTNTSPLVMIRPLPSPIDVEEILSSRAVARTEVFQGDVASPQRLRNIMERDVDVVSLAKTQPFYTNGESAQNSYDTITGTWDSTSESLILETRDFLAAYAKDYLLVEHRFSHLSYPLQYADVSTRRQQIADTLPHQCFENDATVFGAAGGGINLAAKWHCTHSGCHGCGIDAKRFSTASNDSFASRASAGRRASDNFDALSGDFLVENILTQSDLNKSKNGVALPNRIVTLFPLPEKAFMTGIRQRPPMPNVCATSRLHLHLQNFSMSPHFEPLFLSAALYDVQLRQKVSENIYFDVNPTNIAQLLRESDTVGRSLPYAGKCSDALFALRGHDFANLFLVFKLEKILQGNDLNECLEPYVKDVKNREKLYQNAAENCHKLGAYRMPLGWMAMDLRTIIENAQQNARASSSATVIGNAQSTVVKISADEEFESNMDSVQDDTFSVVSVDRLSMNTAAETRLNSAAVSPLTLLGADDERDGRRHGNLMDVFDVVQHIIVSVNSFYKQENERLSDEELLQLLSSRRRVTLAHAGAGAPTGGYGFSRLRAFPVDLRVELSLKSEDETRRLAEASSNFALLTPEMQRVFSGVSRGASFDSAPNALSIVRDALVFMRPNNFFVNHFYRNLLYIYPRFANLSAKGGSYRNICVRVHLRDPQARPLPLLRARDGRLVDEYRCAVSYHTKTPQFLDEIKAHIPLGIADGFHLLFSFYHVSCKIATAAAAASNQLVVGPSLEKSTPADGVESLIGHTWLPLFVDGALASGDFALPIALVDSLPPNIFYLSSNVNVPNVKWLDNHKALFNVTIRTVSTVHPQDHHLNAFFRAYNLLRIGEPDSAGPSHSHHQGSLPVDEDQLRASINNIMKSKPEPLAAFLYIIIDKLLGLITCPPFRDIARTCFETLCQLVKVGTMLLDGGNVDEFGRSQLFLTYVSYHKITPNDLLYGSSDTLCAQIEAAAAALAAGRASDESDNIVDLIKTYEKIDFKALNEPEEDTNTHRLESWTNKKLLHEEIIHQMAYASGAVRESVCLYAWFFFELTLKSMAEYLASRQRFFLPRRLRFGDALTRDISATVCLITGEIVERIAKDAQQTRQLNAALAYFLRDALLLLDRTFVLRQVKFYHDEMATRINAIATPTMQAQLISLKLAFQRILCSHEHFLFVNLPFESAPRTSTFACSAPAAEPIIPTNAANRFSPISSFSNRANDTYSCESKLTRGAELLVAELDHDYLRSHFLLGVVLADLNALLSAICADGALLVTHAQCVHDAIKFVQTLILCHENDARLRVDASLRRRVASLYLPLVGVVVEAFDCLYDAYRDNPPYKDPLANEELSNGNAQKRADESAELSSPSTLSQEFTKSLLISFCWVILNVERQALSRYLRVYTRARLARFIDTLQLCVSLFEYRTCGESPAVENTADDAHVADSASAIVALDVEPNCRRGATATRADFLRGKSASVLVADSSSVCDEYDGFNFNSLQRKKSHCAPAAAAAPAAAVAEMANSLVEFGTVTGGACTCQCAADYDNVPSKYHFGNTVRWRSNEQLLRITTIVSAKRYSIKSSMEMETLLERQLSVEVCAAILATVETIVDELACEESYRFIVPILIQFLTHILSCNLSVTSLEHIFHVQRRILVDFTELILEQKTELCTDVCYQLLRHMGSRFPVIRSQVLCAFPSTFAIFPLVFRMMFCSRMANKWSLVSSICCPFFWLRALPREVFASGTLYLLLRQSFAIPCAFAQLKMQVTIALSNLVSSSLGGFASLGGSSTIGGADKVLVMEDDSPSGLSERHLRRALKTMLDYMDQDLADVSNVQLRDTNFPFHLKSLALNLNMILSDTVKMKHYANDFETLVDLMYRIAKGYQNNPDLRITWLLSLAGRHLERENFMEAGQCVLHCAALVAEYLVMRHYDNDADSLDDDDYGNPDTMMMMMMGVDKNIGALLPQRADDFAELSGNVVEESAISDDIIGNNDENLCNSTHFSVHGFIRLIEKCVLFFEKAQAFELISPLFKMILPVYEAQSRHDRLDRIYRKLADNERRVADASMPRVHERVADAFNSPLAGCDKRCFGTYFRVGFYGAHFGDLNGAEFIYKEPFITKLAEISHRLEAFYANKFGSLALVEVIKDSADVDTSVLDESKAYIQVTYVEPHFEEWDRRRRSSHFKRQFALNAFAYATPFTTARGRAHGQLAEQFKRCTVLRTHNSFPYVKTRLRVVAREQRVLAPIEVAIDDIEKKTRELNTALATQPPDAKILQMLLQGCIGTTVNAGPIQMAKVFLRSRASIPAISGHADATTQHAAHQDRLRLAFKKFSVKCGEALHVNAALIDADRAGYQSELTKNYTDFTAQLAEILADGAWNSNATTRPIATHLRGPATVV